MRQVVDEAHRNAVAHYIDVGGELGSRGVFKSRVRAAGIHRTQTGLGVIRLHVLLQLQAEAAM